jgi:hypothetical protein
MSIQFTQSCPTCGRRTQVRASLLGCTVGCQHCKAEFTAINDQVGDSIAASRIDVASMAPEKPASDELMARVDRVLAKADQTTIT